MINFSRLQKEAKIKLYVSVFLHGFLEMIEVQGLLFSQKKVILIIDSFR